MLQILKHNRVWTIFLIFVLLLMNNALAQPVIYSSDQLPSRWERAMNNRTMNGFIKPVSEHFYSYEKNDASRKTGWGRPPEKLRHKYKRSRTPEYGNGSYLDYKEDPLKRRYALPEPFPVYGYSAHTGNYYGTHVPVPPQLPVAVYPGIYSVGSPVGYPGYGLPNFYPGTGIYPYGGFPGMGYPW